MLKDTRKLVLKDTIILYLTHVENLKTVNTINFKILTGEAREIVLSGNVNDLPEGELNFVLGWDVLAGIIAGGVVLFVLCPIIVLCVAYYRGKKRH